MGVKMTVITKKEIRDILQKHYEGRTYKGIDRKLHKKAMHDNYGAVGSIIYSLDGSPPKGYAIYIPELYQISFYDLTGRRFKILPYSHTVKETSEEVDWLVVE